MPNQDDIFQQGDIPDLDRIMLSDLFSIDELQQIQDAFAKATGVASIITLPDGTPFTRPSRFCRLCKDIIRATDTGRANCFQSDAALGQHNPEGPTVRRCLSGGLWDAGASISVGGRHLGNWLVGQVRNDAQQEAQMLAYARDIGADEKEFLAALREVPVMPLEQFRNVAQVLFLMANQLSEKAYRNLLQAKIIHDKERAQQALRESETRYRSIFENIIDGFYRGDLDGNLLLANPAAMAMMGWNAEDDLSAINLARDIYHNPSDRRAFMSRVLKDGRVDGFTTTLKRRDGETIDVELNARLIYDEATAAPLAIEGIFRDITERKKTQELLVQSEKMISLGELAAGMAHEINNPLGGILQGVQNILRRLSPDLPANTEVARKHGFELDRLRAYIEERNIMRMLEGIRESGERAAGIVRTMLNFSRSNESQRAFCDVSTLIDHALELASSDYNLSRSYDFRNIEIVKDYAPDIPPTPCTATKIEQVILNLLINAAQAMAGRESANGRPRITLRTSRDDGQAVIAVGDNGPGIDKSLCKRIFDPFFTTKPPGQGTGLGLSVSYFIITQNHGGQFSVESTPGEGATFIIRLPLKA